MNLLRQSGVLSSIHLDDVEPTLIGAGGIGSPTALTLAKMGLSTLDIYDPDTVEEHNLPSQLFRKKDLGTSKVLALQEILADFSDCRVVPHVERITQNSSPLSGIVISAVDSMVARSDIWQLVKNSPDVDFYIEARMGFETLRLHSLNPHNESDGNWYQTTLYSDDDAEPEPCTARAIFYTVMTAAGFIGNQVKRHIRCEEVERQIIVGLKEPVLLT